MYKVELYPRDLVRKTPAQALQRARSRHFVSTLCVDGGKTGGKSAGLREKAQIGGKKGENSAECGGKAQIGDKKGEKSADWW